MRRHDLSVRSRAGNSTRQRQGLVQRAIVSSRRGRREPIEREDEFEEAYAAVRAVDGFAGLDADGRRAAIMRHARLPVEIREDLYLGDAAAARDVPRLTELGVTHVLNMAAGELPPPTDAYAAVGIECCAIAAKDDAAYPLLETCLDEARAFLAACRASTARGRS